jgi:L-asparaginase type II
MQLDSLPTRRPAGACRGPRRRGGLLVAGLAALAACAGASGRATAQPAAAAPDTAARPRVLILATGGTIAGVQERPGTLDGYRAGVRSADEIVASVPELARHAVLETEQFTNLPSPALTPAHWVALARRIDSALARPDLAGVVVTHGTDRLEETAFFLYLAVRSDKPVALVGAQRPATGISPDGPINLLAAVRTVASPAAVGKGVVVVMDDRIVSAREVRKHYQRVGGFAGGEMGLLGVVTSRGPTFFYAPVRRHGATTLFDVSRVDSLPTVPLVYSYPGGTGPSLGGPVPGLVVATTGFAPGERAAFDELRRAGTVVVTAFPSGDNVNVPPRDRDDDEAGSTASSPRRPPLPPLVVAQHLTPQKARILLMLALTRTRDPQEIQQLFVEY